VKRCENSLWFRRTSNHPAATFASPDSTSPSRSLRGSVPTLVLQADTTALLLLLRSSAMPQVSSVRPMPSDESFFMPRLASPKDTQLEVPLLGALSRTANLACTEVSLEKAAG
jgi:hypothetical protein